MTQRYIPAAALAACLLSTPAFAVDDEIVVVGSLTPVPAAEMGASVSVIDAEDLELRNADFLSDLLRDVPSVAVSRSGPIGGFTQIRLRGAEADHALTLIDGIEVSDPALDGQVDFATLTGFDIGRIEVLRGAGSAVHGSDALGGVVSLYTPEPTQDLQLLAEGRGGSLGTWAGGAALSGALNDFAQGRIALSHFKTNGISASRLGGEEDGHEVTTAHGKVNATLSDRTHVQLVARHTRSETETDDQDFDCTFDPKTWMCPADNPATYGRIIDADLVSKVKSTQGRAVLTHDLVPDQWQVQAAIEGSRTKADHFDAGALDRATKGGREKYSAQITRFYGVHQFTLAGVHERQSFENMSPAQNRSRKTNSVVGEAQLRPTDNTTLLLGVRHDDNDRFEDFTSWRASGTWALPQSPFTLHASAGTGVKDPGFFELFGFDPSTFVGNPNLKPEQAFNREVGARGLWHDGALTADVTYFQSDITDRINGFFFTPSFDITAVNEPGTARTKGFEVSLTTALPHGAWLSAQYTNLDAKDAMGRKALRRPDVTASANLTLPFLHGLGTADFSADYTGKQQDSDFTDPNDFNKRTTLDSYWLVNLAVQVAVSDALTLFAKGENLLDEDYQEVFTYNATGRTVLVGARARLGH